jgi:FKBP-type peptidyl-prolyl cis-trans isomerase FkpA
MNSSMGKNLAFTLLTLLLLCSCRDSQYKQHVTIPPGKTEMADLNTYMVKKDRERIQNYIERKKLEMTETATGLWYSVTKEGSGEKFRERDRIVMEYECTLLDGTPCYSSSANGPKEIVLGRSELEPGLIEGLKLLRPGSDAIFILPPFLAYGLVGDRKKIPPRSILVYNVSVSRK